VLGVSVRYEHSIRFTRRGVLGASALASLGFWLTPQKALSGDYTVIRLKLEDLISILDTAKRHVDLGMPVYALDILKRLQGSEAIVDIRERPEIYARLLTVLASAHKQAGNVEQGLGAYDQLQILGQSYPDGSMYGSAVVGKLVVLTQHNMAPLGGRLLRAHHGSLRAIREPSFQLEVSARTARILEELGAVEEARDILQREILPLSPDVDDEGEQLDRQMLAIRLFCTGKDRRWGLAEKAIDQARELVSKDESLWRRGQFEAIYGIFLLESGNVEESMRASDSARSLLAISGTESYHAKMLEKMLALKR